MPSCAGCAPTSASLPVSQPLRARPVRTPHAPLLLPAQFARASERQSSGSLPTTMLPASRQPPRAPQLRSRSFPHNWIRTDGPNLNYRTKQLATDVISTGNSPRRVVGPIVDDLHLLVLYLATAAAGQSDGCDAPDANRAQRRRGRPSSAAHIRVCRGSSKPRKAREEDRVAGKMDDRTRGDAEWMRITGRGWRQRHCRSDRRVNIDCNGPERTRCWPSSPRQGRQAVAPARCGKPHGA